MKKLILISILLLGIGAAVAAYIFMTKPPPPTFPSDAHPTLPITFYSWKKPETAYALLQRFTGKGDLVISPNKVYTASLHGEVIVISKDTEQVYAIPLNENIAGVQFFWLTDQFFIIVEKEKADLQVDNFYIVDMKNGDKQFFTGSFAVPSRLNLDKQIGIYENGHVLVMEDMEGNLWQLDIMF